MYGFVTGMRLGVPEQMFKWVNGKERFALVVDAMEGLTAA
jgi:hypothetical protein